MAAGAPAIHRSKTRRAAAIREILGLPIFYRSRGMGGAVCVGRLIQLPCSSSDSLGLSQMNIPSFKNRSPADIITEKPFYESSGRIYRAMSWLNYAKANRNISALEYAALETRFGIEQLLFEQLIVGVGSKLDIAEYKKCTGQAKKLSQLIENLIPKYEHLIEFTKAVAPKGFPVTKWDNRLLCRFSGKISEYLHWSGGLDVTVESATWFETGLGVVDTAASYVWRGLTTGNTGVIRIDKLEPKMLKLWELYSTGKISIEHVVQRADALEQRTLGQSKA